VDDLKPDNVFLEEVRGGDHVKLLDFGIAKLRRDVELRVTRTGVVLGTPLYMSPEQTRGLRDVDARTDVHAVGVMLFEMIAGRPPYFGDNANLVVFQILSGQPPSLRTIAPEVPIELDAIVMRAFSPDRAKRFGSARELREALERYLWHRPRDLIAADAAVPPAGAQPRTASPSHLEVHVEEPSWFAPSKAPPKAEYLSATPPPRLPLPRVEEHAATARSIPIDEASRHPSLPSVPAVPSSFVPPFAALSAAQHAARRKSGLSRLVVVALALLVGAVAGVRVLLHHHAWLLRTQPSAPASK
jgi:serine/threonine-protein kinase